MAMFDLALDELRSYRPEVVEPKDFDAFWSSSIEEARAAERAPFTMTKIDNRLTVIDTYDVVFPGAEGAPIKAWLHVPAGTDGPLPTVVQYHGYSGGRGLPYVGNHFAQAGWAHWVMDTRGQGWSAGGDSGTVDDSPYAGSNHVPGFLTAGIEDPYRYYYRRVYLDAVRLLDAVTVHPMTDPGRIIVTGGSQGGGITLAAAGLAPVAGLDLLAAAPDVPFLCHFQRALQITDRLPYGEITRYLAGWRDQVDQAYHTLSYFDGVNLGRRARVPTLFSVALMDAVCPPSTVFAAFNHYGGATSVDKRIEIYSHNDHEGGGTYQTGAQLTWFSELFG